MRNSMMSLLLSDMVRFGPCREKGVTADTRNVIIFSTNFFLPEVCNVLIRFQNSSGEN